MKTKIGGMLITLVLVIMANTEQLIAGDNLMKSQNIISSEETNKSDVQSNSTASAMIDEYDSSVKVIQDTDRQYWEDLVAVPWIMQAVIVKPSKKVTKASDKSITDEIFKK
jgi:hypothetical protein